MFCVKPSVKQFPYNYFYQKRVYNAVFPKVKLSFDETLKNVSLVFLNSHVSIHGPRPFVSNMVEIGGIHLDKPTQPLPQVNGAFLHK